MSKILDIPRSIEAANGNIALARDLFKMLLDDLDNRLQQIEDSFQAGDMDALEEYVHKLYGATAYCIVPQLRELAGTLEDQLRAKHYDKLDSLVTAISEEIRNLIQQGPALAETDWSAYVAT